MKYLLIINLMVLIACQSSPQEVLTSENAKVDAIKLLQDLKFDYKGIHCGQPFKTMMDRHNYVWCNVSSDSESAKIHCKLHDCQLVEKRSLRIKFGWMK